MGELNILKASAWSLSIESYTAEQPEVDSRFLTAKDYKVHTITLETYSERMLLRYDNQTAI